MATFVWYVFLLGLLAVVLVGGFWFLRSYLNGVSPRAALFGPRPEPRLAVVDHASIDGRRRLVLIRRDDTEHLIMTGGPVDVVIETGIVAADRYRSRDEPEIVPAQPVQPTLPSQPVFSRPPRVAAGAGESATE